MANVICPFCGSTAIYRLQRDHDGSDGTYYAYVNDAECYEEFSSKIPDVDIHHCSECNRFFEPGAEYPKAEVVMVSALREAIANLEKHIRWLTDNYKAACLSTMEKVRNSHYKDMATTLPVQFKDLQKSYIEIKEYEEQVKLLYHIIDKHSIGLPTVHCETQVEDAE